MHSGLQGRVAILNHDFPRLFEQDSAFAPVQMPTSSAHLKTQDLLDRFISRMKATWPNFFHPEEVDGRRSSPLNA